MSRKSTQSLIPMKSGGGALKKLFAAAVVIVIIVMVIKFPGESADMVNDARDGGDSAIDSLWAFIQSLRNG